MTGGDLNTIKRSKSGQLSSIYLLLVLTNGEKYLSVLVLLLVLLLVFFVLLDT